MTTRQKLIHLLFASVFLVLPVLLVPPHPQDAGDSFFNYLIAKKAITNALFVLLFYVNYLVLTPQYYFNKRYFEYAIYLILAGAIIIALPELLWAPKLRPGMMGPPMMGPPMMGLPRDVEVNIVLFLTTVILSIALNVYERWQLAEKMRLDAELSFLKAQIHPHFLFNTLNSIYTLAIKKSDQTASAIVKLSSLMRYVTTDAQTDYVLLNKEINYLNNYIELQSLRLGNTAALSINIEQDRYEHQITPLILIPFIENAFKYGINSDEYSPINITLECHETYLILQTRNRKFELSKDNDESSGLGIKNVQNRLNLMYTNKYTLDLQETEHDYTVYLKLELI